MSGEDMKKLQEALDIIDKIDTMRQAWDYVDERLHCIQGLVREVLINQAFKA